MSAKNLTGFNDVRNLRDAATLITPTGESIDDYGEAKLTTQWRSLKKIGLGTIFFILTGIASTTIAIEQLVSPAIGQAKQNGITNSRLDSIAATQKENDERQARLAKESEDRQNKALLDGLARIETAVGVQGTALGQLRQDTMGLWKWATALDGRIGMLEADSKKREK